MPGCTMRGRQIDDCVLCAFRCVLYAFRCAVYAASTKSPDPEWLPS